MSRTVREDDAWGSLTRVSDTSGVAGLPLSFYLTKDETYFGRNPQPDKTLFQHEYQLVLPVPFVSSTHFAIVRKLQSYSDENSSEMDLNTTAITSIGGNESDDKPESSETKEEQGMRYKYYLYDYSRNGTLVNETLVGNNNFKEISPNDQIFINFKSQSVILQFLVNNKLSTSSSATGSCREVVNEAFAAQLTSLKEENQELERRLKEEMMVTERLQGEITTIQKDNKIQLQLMEEKEKEMTELKNHIKDLESVQSTYTARVHSLEDQLEEKNNRYIELNNKYEKLLQELEYRNQLLGKRDTLITDLNKSILGEKRRYEQCNEDKISLLGSLEDLDEKYQHATLENMNLLSALQEEKKKSTEWMSAHQQLHTGYTELQGNTSKSLETMQRQVQQFVETLQSSVTSFGKEFTVSSSAVMADMSKPADVRVLLLSPAKSSVFATQTTPYSSPVRQLDSHPSYRSPLPVATAAAIGQNETQVEFLEDIDVIAQSKEMEDIPKATPSKSSLVARMSTETCLEVNGEVNDDDKELPSAIIASEKKRSFHSEESDESEVPKKSCIRFNCTQVAGMSQLSAQSSVASVDVSQELSNKQISDFSSIDDHPIQRQVSVTQLEFGDEMIDEDDNCDEPPNGQTAVDCPSQKSYASSTFSPSPLNHLE